MAFGSAMFIFVLSGNFFAVLLPFPFKHDVLVCLSLYHYVSRKVFCTHVLLASLFASPQSKHGVFILGAAFDAHSHAMAPPHMRSGSRSARDVRSLADRVQPLRPLAVGRRGRSHFRSPVRSVRYRGKIDWNLWCIDGFAVVGDPFFCRGYHESRRRHQEELKDHVLICC